MKPIQPKKASNYYKKKIEQFKQAAVPKVIDHPFLRESKKAVEFHFEKGSPSLKITVLDREQSQAKRMIKPRKEVKINK